MTIEEGKRVVLEELKARGRATNRTLLQLLGGDAELLEGIREELILDDLARDKEGVGLVYLEPAAPGAASPAEHETREAVPVKIVFISYGRDDEGIAFVDRLAQDLASRGVCEPWVDRLHGIKLGDPFDSRIEHGILDSTVVLAVLTTYGTRDESVCRNEIIFAIGRGKPVVPLRIDPEVPGTLMVCRNNWVDFTQGYEAGLDALVGYLSGEGETLQTVPLDRVWEIEPLDFSDELARHLSGFVGRAWLDADIDRWLKNPQERALVIVGEPGIGKSAIAAWLTEHRASEVVGVHFCRRELLRRVDPYEFVASLAAQLAVKLPGFAKMVDPRKLETRLPSGTDAFQELIVDPVLKLPRPDGPRLIVIDALDEAAGAGDDTIIKVIANCAENLPTWLRIVATTRPEAPVLKAIEALNPYSLQADQPRNLEDVASYVREFVAEHQLAAKLGMGEGELVRRVESLAEGNFLYAHKVLEAFEAGEFTVADLGELVPGLAGYYRTAFSKAFPAAGYYERSCRPVLQALCVAYAPLSVPLLALVCHRSPEEVEEAVGDLGSWLRVTHDLHEGEGYSLYHKSLRDWLVGAEAPKAYRCARDAGHALMADGLLGHWREQPYAQRHLPAHLLAAAKWAELQATLEDLDFFAGHAVGGDYTAWMRFWRALPKAPAPEVVYEAELEARFAAQGETAELAALAHLVGCFLRDLDHNEAATRVLQRAVEVRQRVLPPYDPALADSVHALAETARRRKDFSTALGLFQEALGLRERLLGQESAAVAHSLHDLAELYHDLDQYDQALSFYQRSLETARRACMPANSPLVPRCLNDMGALYYERGHSDKALPLYREALELFETQIGAGYIEAGETLHNIALVETGRGDRLAAFAHFTRSLVVIGNTYPLSHDKTRRVMSALSDCWFSGPKNDLAFLRAKEEALPNLFSVGRGDLRFLSRLVSDLARDYHQAGDDEAAARTLGQLTQALAEEDQDPLSAARRLLQNSCRLRRLGQRPQAEEARRTALRKQEEALAEDVAADREIQSMAQGYMDAMAYEAAYPLYQRALERAEADSETGPVALSQALNQLGFVCLKGNRLAEAEGYLRRSLEAKRDTGVDPAGDVAPTLNNLAETCLGQGRLDEAGELLTEALRLREAAGDPLRLAITQATQAALLWRRGDLAGAGALLQRVLEVYEQAGHPSSFQVEALARCAAVQRELGHVAEAADLEDRAQSMRDELWFEAWEQN